VIFRYIIIVLSMHKTIANEKCDSILLHFRQAKIKAIDTSL
jgi:hypothetical protein